MWTLFWSFLRAPLPHVCWHRLEGAEEFFGPEDEDAEESFENNCAAHL